MDDINESGEPIRNPNAEADIDQRAAEGAAPGGDTEPDSGDTPAPDGQPAKGGDAPAEDGTPAATGEGEGGTDPSA